MTIDLKADIDAIQKIARTTLEFKAEAAPKRLTPIQEINAQYSAFQAGFEQQLANYVATLNESSTGSVTVSATVTAAYTAGSPLIQVNDASVFGPPGRFAAPVPAPSGMFWTTMPGRPGMYRLI